MLETKHVLKILKKVRKAIERNDTFELKNLSNQTIHSASINQDNENISLAVTIYALGKIFERTDYRTLKGWDNFYNLVIQSLNNSISALEKNDLENFKVHFIFIGKAINKISGKLKDYIQHVFEKAKVNKASRIHEHGISLEKTAKLLGTNLYDLASYTGRSGIPDVSFNKTINTKDRIKLIERFFE
jgi:hypothetical protein